MSSILTCPVCGQPLSKNDKCYYCDRGHTFDIARRGYVNLLTGNGGTHGDNALMIEGRRTFLDGGYYAPLAMALEEALVRYAPRTGVYLDVGCGECYYTAHATRALGELQYQSYAFDVSKEAIKSGARRKCGATLFTASAYRMPVMDTSVDVITLFFSPFCREELLRALRKNGLFIMAIPGEEHLWELKQAVYDTPYRNAPTDREIEGFALIEEKHLHNTIAIEGTDMIKALFSMTPYYYKTSARDRAKLDCLTTLKTQTEFHLLIYRKL